MPRNWPSSSRLGRIYLALVILRVFVAFYSTGYIHPDEYFQNGEIVAGDALGLHTLRTWEWDPDFPCRSIVAPLFTTGLPFYILRYVWRGPFSPLIMFRLERLVSLSYSFVLDYCVSQLVPNPTLRGQALILLASSYVMHTFQTRPFSNSLEAVLVALFLVSLQDLLSSPRDSSTQNFPKNGRRSLTVLAMILVLGIFARMTFIAFALPAALEALKWTLQTDFAVRHRRLYSIRLIFPVFLTAVFAASAVVIADTLYFRGDLTTFVLTPLNFLRYNMSASNLADHGLHPRWLHVVVNLPMIIGPGLLYYTATAAMDIFRRRGEEKVRRGVVESMMRTSFYTIVTSLAILSMQPHQEPRFLTPLLVPCIVLAAQSGHIQRSGKLFWSTWILSNITLAIMFGVLHQGGVVPSLLHLHDQIHEHSKVSPLGALHIYYWKTYMPPRHLLGIDSKDVLARKITFTDLAGAPPDVLLQDLVALSVTADTTTWLVAPLHALHSSPHQRASCFTMQERIFPHLDLDNIPESLELGWRDGLSLGLYSVEVDCLRAVAA